MKNIKKIFSIMLVFVFAFSVFSITVNGENSDLIITEDYENVYLDSENYIKINGIYLEEDYPQTIEAELKPLETQKDIKTVEIQSNEEKTVLKITFSFSNGDVKTSYYIHYLHEEKYKFAFKQPYSLNFNYSDKSLSITKEEIEEAIQFGEKAVINKNGLYADEFHKIISQRDEFTIIIGFIILGEDGNFYYTDCEIAKKHSPDEINYNYSSELSAIKLRDSELLSVLEEGYKNSTPQIDSPFGEIASVILLAIFFLLLPIALLVISIVAKTKSKKPIYKKMWSIVLILSVAEIILFLVSAFIILK